jgi:hypothetical protein
VLSGLVFGLALLFITDFIRNEFDYAEVYEDIQFMNIVLFKELIQKVTGYQLEPFIKMSTFNQKFYLETVSDLRELPTFQVYWQ